MESLLFRKNLQNKERRYSESATANPSRIRGESNSANFSLRHARAGSLPEIRKLLRPNSEEFLALDVYFDAEGRAQIGSLHDPSANPGAAAGQIGGFERVEHRAAAGVADHGMFRGAEAVIIFQLVQVGDVFELAISVRGFLLEGPVAACLGRGACRQTNEKRGDIFAGEAVANKKFFRGPGLGHLGHVGDPRIRSGRMREQGVRIGRWRRNFDLRL